MHYKDLFKETFFAVAANKARSGLTVLGIVIGIGSVIAMISIGQGASSSITQSIESSGSNLLTISPGAGGGFGPVSEGQGSAETLTMEDAEAVGDLSLIETVSPVTSGRYQVVVKGNNTNTSINGVTNSYQEANNIKMEKGSFISESNVDKSSKVAVLGKTATEDLFGEGVDPTGETIRIDSLSFKVLGVMKETGSGFNSSDDAILIPISVAQKYLTGNESVSSISVKIAEQDQMDVAEEDIFALLLKRHGFTSEDDADFQVMNMADMVEMASSITGTLTILLGAIASISLVVGGIGIMNMMLTSVTERTREIGLRKAIGARSKDVSNQFLAESVMLTFSGGFIGVVLGYATSFLVNLFLNTGMAISLFSTSLGFGVSVIIGIIFGYYPARRAAKLNPIDALRYE
ncbi:MAG: ABC transporter permease [Patescibacteria group bacterium]